jgi:hypothetical protein
MLLGAMRLAFGCAACRWPAAAGSCLGLLVAPPQRQHPQRFAGPFEQVPSWRNRGVLLPPTPGVAMLLSLKTGVAPPMTKQLFAKTVDGKGCFPSFDNKLDCAIDLYYISARGLEKPMDEMAPGEHRPPKGWSVYPRTGCWVAKREGKEILRVSSTTVCEYGFSVGESANEEWIPGCEEALSAPAAAAGAAPVGLLSGASATLSTTLGSGAGAGASAWQVKSATGFVGLANQGATCYLNSLLQSMYMTPELRLALYQWDYSQMPTERAPARPLCIPFQLQRLFVDLQTSKQRAVSTSELTKSFGCALPTALPTALCCMQQLCRHRHRRRLSRAPPPAAAPVARPLRTAAWSSQEAAGARGGRLCWDAPC